MAKMGRPKIELDFQEVKKLMQFKPSLSDTAVWFDCSEDTIIRIIKKQTNLTFAKFRHQNMAKIRIKLVQKAFQMALSGERVMLIFCLKNMNGWADIPSMQDEDIEGIEFA